MESQTVGVNPDPVGESRASVAGAARWRPAQRQVGATRVV